MLAATSLMLISPNYIKGKRKLCSNRCQGNMQYKLFLLRDSVHHNFLHSIHHCLSYHFIEVYRPYIVLCLWHDTLPHRCCKRMIPKIQVKNKEVQLQQFLLPLYLIASRKTVLLLSGFFLSALQCPRKMANTCQQRPFWNYHPRRKSINCIL